MAFRTLFLFIVVATTVGAAAAVPVPTWCIADWDNAATMKNGQNWACVEGGVDCSPIHPPIGLCFHPNSTLFHASFAYNAYYHMQTGAPGSCYFNGTANDPSTSFFDSKETQKSVFEAFRKYNKFIHSADWLICNSTYDLEPAAFNLFPKIRPVGPLLASNRRGRPAGSFWTEDSSSLKWLDQQPPSSVIYIAFGSFTVFNKSQFRELAQELELTNRRFLWVVRPDITEQTDEAYPKRFMARVADRGRMVGWAPQQQVLSHPAIACFVSHCGWNSTVEGVCNGLPFLCWPYFADQLFNENYVCDVWKIGLRFEKDVNGIISKDEIVAKVENILCDRGFKERAMLVKDKTLSSIKDEGSSIKNIQDFIQWTKA